MGNELWPGSSLILDGMMSDAVAVSVAPPASVLFFLLAVALTLLLSFSRVVVALRGATFVVRGNNSTMEVLGNKYDCDSIFLSYLLLLPVYALTLLIDGVSSLDYWMTLVVLVALMLFRRICLAVSGWLSGRRGAMRQVSMVGRSIMVPVVLISSLTGLLVRVFPDISRTFIFVLLIVIAAAGYIVYVKRSFDIINSSGFSRFFWFLYLCALDILPICVAVNIMFNGN